MWKKNERSRAARRATGAIRRESPNLLTARRLFHRTGLGANRRRGARRRAFRALSAEISTGFSAAVSENWFVAVFTSFFRSDPL
jgi:hypothetical protein